MPPLLLIIPFLTATTATTIPPPPPEIVRWQSGAFPAAVPTRGVPDGPLTGNGDVGVVIGGGVDAGARLGDPTYRPSTNTTRSSLGLYLGKSDFWGWPDAVTYHASFQHFSAGYVLLGLRDGTTDTLLLPDFRASMRLADGALAASASSPSSGYALSVQARVVSSRNAVAANITASCPAGVDAVDLDVTLSTDTMFGMPVTVNASTLTMVKDNTFRDGFHPLVLVPCARDQIVFNALRTFKVNQTSRVLAVHNATAGPAERHLCLSLNGDGEDRSVWTTYCGTAEAEAEASATQWLLDEHSGSLTSRGWCLRVQRKAGTNATSASCPGGASRSYYTDASVGGACQSHAWDVVAVRCAAGGQQQRWTLDKNSGFLSVLAPDGTGTPGGSIKKCLASVPPTLRNSVAVSLAVKGGDIIDTGGRSGVRMAAATRRVRLRCGATTVRLGIGVASQRDAGSEGTAVAAGGRSAAVALAKENAAAAVDPKGLVSALAATDAWFAEFYGQSAVDLGPEWETLDMFYKTMTYLSRVSMRVDKIHAAGPVAPGLWGAFTITDFSGWSDQMTLDYNFMANYWSSATANRPELILPYASTVTSEELVGLARARAGARDWSLGGWPDQFGAEVMGMSCGPTPDWDHDFGCDGSFGGFDGMAFVSCTGPFAGMACCFDDGTRFVAGLVSTPLVQYYDATLDEDFLRHTLLPFLRDVAAFYMSYAIPGHDGGNSSSNNKEAVMLDLPYTCAQEICMPHAADVSNLTAWQAEHNAHQDHAYMRLALSKLLAYTSPGAAGAGTTTADERAAWARALAQLRPFPTQPSPLGPVFAEAETRDPTTGARTWPPATANAAYPIAHFAAMHPAEVVDLASPPELLAAARNTVLLEDVSTEFAPGGAGFCLAWPAAAKVATRATGRALLRNFTAAHALQTGGNNGTNNGWPDDGGGGLEDIGSLAALHMLLVQHIDGALVLFPAWPEDATARTSFTTLRVPGAFLVSAMWENASVASPVLIFSERGGVVVLATPWPSSVVSGICVSEHDDEDGAREEEKEEHQQHQVKVTTQPGRAGKDVDPLGRVSWETRQGKWYHVAVCGGVGW